MFGGRVVLATLIPRLLQLKYAVKIQSDSWENTFVGNRLQDEIFLFHSSLPYFFFYPSLFLKETNIFLSLKSCVIKGKLK